MRCRSCSSAPGPAPPFAPVARAFQDFELAFTGRMPGYFGVDTVYHDQQHTLDVTLAMARLMVGYETRAMPARRGRWAPSAPPSASSSRCSTTSATCASAARPPPNGAEFTRNHVTRSARFMEYYLPTIGFAHWTRITSEIVHFTGYEKTFEQIGAEGAAIRATSSSATCSAPPT